MTVQAPLHVERLGAPDKRHLIDRSVAGRATNPLGNVNAVIEIDEVRQIIDPVPCNWFPGG